MLFHRRGRGEAEDEVWNLRDRVRKCASRSLRPSCESDFLQEEREDHEAGGHVGSSPVLLCLSSAPSAFSAVKLRRTKCYFTAEGAEGAERQKTKYGIFVID